MLFLTRSCWLEGPAVPLCVFKSGTSAYARAFTTSIMSNMHGPLLCIVSLCHSRQELVTLMCKVLCVVKLVLSNTRNV